MPLESCDDVSADFLLRVAEVHAAVERLPPEERKARLDQECGAGTALRAAVERSLASQGAAETCSHVPEAPQVGPVRDRIPPCAGVPTLPGYTNLKELGRSKMSVVYHAQQQSPARPVVIKLVERAAEADAVALLDHPHIVPVFGTGKWHPTEGPAVPYFVMKWCPGGSLSAAPTGRGTDPVAHARVVATVARAVHHAHQRGWLHCDLKPSNILLDDARQPHVADFGLALRVENARGTRPGRIAGTPAYMAPEQAAGQPLTTAVDVYGLGAVIYALLTGRPPFRGRTDEETLRQVRDAGLQPVPPRAINSDVDPDLQAICLKCLDREPAARYASAVGLAKDLDLWLAGQESSALKWKPFYRAWRRIKRNKVLTGLVGAAVVFVAILDGFAAYKRVADREEQVLKSNAYTAQSVANTFDGRLQFWSSAVQRECRNPALRADLKSGNQTELAARVAAIHAWYADPANGFTREGKAPPFAGWFVTDGVGQVVAHSQRDVQVKDARPWRERDYFQGASGKKDGAVYVSRVYQSDLTGRYYKFALAAPIRDGEHLAGVIVATIMTDSAEDTLLPKYAPQRAVLVGRWDGNPLDSADVAAHSDKHPPGQRLILLHSEFERGHVAAEIHNEHLFDDGAFARQGYGLDENYADPVTQSPTSAPGRWLAASAPVKDTEFVVVVQQDYEEAVRRNPIILRFGITWGAVLFASAGCTLAMTYSVLVRNRLASEMGT